MNLRKCTPLGKEDALEDATREERFGMGTDRATQSESRVASDDPS